jgi:diguanylate cyclase (GGDEF)-like protein/PAS domain S-box-containing protein
MNKSINSPPKAYLEAQLERYASDFGDLSSVNAMLELRVKELQRALTKGGATGNALEEIATTFRGFFHLLSDRNGRILSDHPLPKQWAAWHRSLASGQNIWSFFNHLCVGGLEQAQTCRRAMEDEREFRCMQRDGKRLLDVYQFSAPGDRDHLHWLLCPSNPEACGHPSQLCNLLFSKAKKGVLLCDGDASIIGLNDAAIQLSGFSRHELLGSTPRLLLSDRHDEAFYRAMRASLFSHGKWDGVFWSRQRNGQTEPKWLRILVTDWKNGRPSGYLGVFCDSALFERIDPHAFQFAHFDPLTGLSNRTTFMGQIAEYLGYASQNKRSLTVLYIDLNRFQDINHALGYEVGDMILTRFADRLNTLVRATDTVARLSGDQFALLLYPSSGTQGAERVAMAIIHNLNQPCEIDGQEIYLHASIGIATYPDHADNPTQLLHHAERAMQQTRIEGASYLVYTKDMSIDPQRLRITNALHDALTDFKYLQLLYQPQVEASSGRIVGIEALVRLSHPAYGSIPPDLFIPIAEEQGLIQRLDAWVLRQACRQQRQWHAEGLSVRVAVNLSASEFRDPSLAERIMAILREESTAPEYLELEVTETAIMADSGHSNETLRKLRRSGLRLSIDDFGTGHSNLARLRDLPLSRLKIDRSFIDSMTLVNRDLELVRAIISFASALGMKTVAEGVEYLDQLNALCSLGCDEIQGYLYARPLTAQKMGALLKKGRLAPDLCQLDTQQEKDYA